VQGLNIVRVISLFYLGQWNYRVFEWAHLYVWQALIMLDVLIVWLVWVRLLRAADEPGPPAARRRIDGAGIGVAAARAASVAMQLGGFVIRVIGWLPVAFVVWYFAAPILLWPAALVVKLIAQVDSRSRRGIEQSARRSCSRLRSGPASLRRSRRASPSMSTCCSTRSAFRSTRRWSSPRAIRAGRGCSPWATSVLTPFVAWGVLADFLKNVAITAGPLIASQTASSRGSARRSRSPISWAR
jgi:hypothetical protein